MRHAIFLQEHKLVEQVINLANLPQPDREMAKKLLSEKSKLADNLNDVLNQLLSDADLSEWIELIPDQPMPNVEGYGARIRTTRNNDQITSITFYKVKDAAFSTILGLTGFTVGVLLLSPTLPLTGVSLLYTTLKNVVVLRREDNGIAIDAYEAFLATCTGNKRDKATTQEVLEKYPGKDRTELRNGLITLSQKGILKLESWGGSTNDWEHLSNVWRLKL